MSVFSAFERFQQLNEPDSDVELNDANQLDDEAPVAVGGGEARRGREGEGGGSDGGSAGT